jgi:tetratricopeptide (TPR) repeat protein
MSSANDFYEAGNRALAIGELADAETEFRKATIADPRFFDAWHALGMVLYKQNKYPEAIAAGLKAIAIEPNDQMAWTSLSIAYMRNGQVPEAEDASAKAKVISWGGKVDKMQKD